MENRQFNHKDVAIDIGIKSFEERTTYLLRQVLDSNLKTISPIVVGEDGSEKFYPVDNIIEGLEFIDYLVELREKIKKDSFSKSEIEEADKKLDVLSKALTELEVVIATRCSYALIVQNGVNRLVGNLLGETKAAEEEKRETGFPPELDNNQ